MAVRLIKLLLSFVAVALAAQAGEFVVLSNGFRIHADSHIADGSVIRLQTSQGVIEIQASTVAAFEQEDYIAPLLNALAAWPLLPHHRPSHADAARTGHACGDSCRSASGHCA